MIKDLLILAIFPGAMVYAAAIDLFTMTLPNRLTLALAVSFFVVASLVGMGWYAVVLHCHASAPLPLMRGLGNLLVRSAKIDDDQGHDA